MSKKSISVFIFLCMLPLFGICQPEGPAKRDSLLQVLKVRKADTTKVNILNDLSISYAQEDPQTGLRYAAEGLQLATQLKWNEGIAGAHFAAAYNYFNRSSYDSAVIMNLLALQLYEEVGNRRRVAVTLGHLALSYCDQSDFSTALEYQFRALKKFEELKDKRMIARSLLNIGNIYSSLSDRKAIAYCLDALKCHEQLGGDKQGVAVCYLNLGNSYYQQKEYDQALSYLLKSLQLSREIGDSAQLQITIGNIGSTYLALGNSPLALVYGFEALKLSKESNDEEGIICAFADVGRAYLALSKGQYKEKLPDSLARITKQDFLKKSIFYLNGAVVKNSDPDNLVLYYESLKSLSEAYEMSGDKAKALESYKLFAKIKDSVTSEDVKVKIARQETKREADLKEKQIEVNKLSKANANKRMELVLIGTAILLVVTVVVFRINKRLVAEKKTSDKLRSDLEDTLEQKTLLMQKISDSADLKSKFFANVSHELRTPVTILSGMLGLMRQKDWTEVDKNKLEVAFANSRRLELMVEEMLDISKLEHPGSGARYEIKDIARLVERIAISFSSYVEQSKIGFSFDASAVEGVLVATDEQKMEKIIANLLYNAIKFSRQGGNIKIVLTTSLDNKWVNIEVSDTGRGIDQKDLPYIFDRYYQSSSDTSKAGGMGIGLSLVREFTHLLGGEVSVSSRLGEGTTFTLRYPLFEGEVEERLADIDEVAIPSIDLHFSNSYTILLVEDNMEMRYYLREVLLGNMKLVEMENGQQALDWLKNNPADMIISDVMMPEMDGREFISILKSDDELRKIPIITISALSDQSNQLSLLRLGIDDYIVKPFNPIELRVRVRNLLINLEERKIYEQQPAEEGDVSGESTEVAEFKAKLQEYVLARMKKHDVSVHDVAYDFSLSQRQLYRLAKGLTGFTPAQLIKEVKLQKAYELVVNRKVTKIEALAKEVGFENASYFAKQFAERFGRKPSEYF